VDKMAVGISLTGNGTKFVRVFAGRLRPKLVPDVVPYFRMLPDRHLCQSLGVAPGDAVFSGEQREPSIGLCMRQSYRVLGNAA
jgi:hypothetical protein